MTLVRSDLAMSTTAPMTSVISSRTYMSEHLRSSVVANVIIGDRAADLSAGKNGGLCRGIHVATGHGDDVEQNAAVLLKDTYFDVVLSTSIADAIKHITF